MQSDININMNWGFLILTQFPGDTSLYLDMAIGRFMSYDFSGNVVLSHGDEDGPLTLFVRWEHSHAFCLANS